MNALVCCVVVGVAVLVGGCQSAKPMAPSDQYPVTQMLDPVTEETPDVH